MGAKDEAASEGEMGDGVRPEGDLINVVSEKKKRKQVNAYLCKGGLKQKETGIKGLTFFTSSERKRLNKKSFDNIFDSFKRITNSTVFYFIKLLIRNAFKRVTFKNYFFVRIE